MTEQEWSATRGMTRKRGTSLAPFGRVIQDLRRRDHASVWLADDGSPVLVLQPYHFEFEHMREMVAICDRHRLDGEIDPHANWHHENVIGIVLRFVDQT